MNLQDPVIIIARMTRLEVIRAFYEVGLLSEEEAKGLLRGRLDPKDPDTVIDDSELLCANDENVVDTIGKTAEAFNDL